MKFKDLDCCPFCGDNEYYTKSYVRGTIRMHSKYDHKFETITNSAMYDDLTRIDDSGRAYCSNCDSYLGNYKKDVVGKKALAELRKQKSERRDPSFRSSF